MRLRFGLEKAAFICAYLYSGLACLLGSFLCAFLFLVPIRVASKEREIRRLIHWLCAGLVGYLRFFKLLDIDFGTLHQLRQRRGAIIAVNHPTFIDAILVMSQLPNVFCLMKVSLLRNPFIAVWAKSAGYENNENPGPLIENCSRRLCRGENLLVFPEGTRTVTGPIGRLKRGFAVMALRAQVPVVTVIATSLNGSYLRKGQPFFGFPKTFPLRYRFFTSQEFKGTSEEQSRDFCLKIESHFHDVLSRLN